MKPTASPARSPSKRYATSAKKPCASSKTRRPGSPPTHPPKKTRTKAAPSKSPAESPHCLCLCFCLFHCRPFRSIKTKRHLDRSWSQSHRDQRSGEIPVFAFAVARSFVCHPVGICCCSCILSAAKDPL